MSAAQDPKAASVSEDALTNPAKPFEFPKSLNPTESLNARLNHWRKLVKALTVYLRELSDSSKDSFKFHSRAASILSEGVTAAPGAGHTPAQSRKVSAAQAPVAAANADSSSSPASKSAGSASAPTESKKPVISAPKQAVPPSPKSLFDVPETLQAMHQEIAEAAQRLPDIINRDLLPRLSQIDKELQAYAGRLKGTSSQFRNAPAVQQAQGSTKAELEHYKSAIAAVKDGRTPVTDPYLLRLSVENHLEKQVSLENSLLDAYATSEQDAAKVDHGVVVELQAVLNVLQASLAATGAPMTSVAKSFVEGPMRTEPIQEFRSYVESQPQHFLSRDVKARSVSQAVFPDHNSPFARPVKSGQLERRTKYLKSFTAADYVLTPSTLIELKGGQPVLGIDLTDAQLVTDHKHASGDRFVLDAAQAGSASGKRHTWVFRADDAASWTEEINKLISAKSPEDRCRAAFGQEVFDDNQPNAPFTKTSGTSTAAGAGAAIGATGMGVAAVAGTGTDSSIHPEDPLSIPKEIKTIKVDPADVKSEGGVVKADSSAGPDAALAASGQSAPAPPSLQRATSEAPSTAALSTTAVKSVKGVSEPISSTADTGAAVGAGVAGAAGGAVAGVAAGTALGHTSEKKELSKDIDTPAEGGAATTAGVNKQPDFADSKTGGAIPNVSGASAIPSDGAVSSGTHDPLSATKSDSGAIPGVSGSSSLPGESSGLSTAGIAAGGAAGGAALGAGTAAILGSSDSKRESDEASSDMSELSGEGYRNLLQRANAEPVDFQSEVQSDIEPHSAAWQADRDLASLTHPGIGEKQEELPVASNSLVSAGENTTSGTGTAGVAGVAGVAAGAGAGAGTLASQLGNNGVQSSSAIDDSSSVFSYDLTHKATTYDENEDFKPVDADLPPKVERRLTQTSHKYTDPAAEGIGAARTETEAAETQEAHLTRRRSSVSVKSLTRKPSRRATASFGGDELKPLTTGQDEQGDTSGGLFFAEGLPKTTAGSAK